MFKNLMFTLFITLISTATMAQLTSPYMIEGKVVDDADQSPLIGVSILVKGTTLGAVTGIDGDFRLNIPDSCATIIISYTGFTTETLNQVCSNGKPTFVSLQASAEVLDEVVVTGYAVEEKSSVSASVAADRRGKGRKTRTRANRLMAYDAAPAPARYPNTLPPPN